MLAKHFLALPLYLSFHHVRSGRHPMFRTNAYVNPRESQIVKSGSFEPLWRHCKRLGVKSLLTPTAIRISRETKVLDPLLTDSERQQGLSKPIPGRERRRITCEMAISRYLILRTRFIDARLFVDGLPDVLQQIRNDFVVRLKKRCAFFPHFGENTLPETRSWHASARKQTYRESLQTWFSTSRRRRRARL